MNQYFLSILLKDKSIDIDEEISVKNVEKFRFRVDKQDLRDKERFSNFSLNNFV